jgi:S-adenosylmethionine hydrolase
LQGGHGRCGSWRQSNDITHQVTPFDIAEGARFLAGSAPYFAKDAVFVAVVDPGVGTSRKAIIARSRVGQFFVLPDNGLLTLVQTRDGIALAAPRQGGVRRASGFVQVDFPDN